MNVCTSGRRANRNIPQDWKTSPFIHKQIIKQCSIGAEHPQACEVDIPNYYDKKQRRPRNKSGGMVKTLEPKAQNPRFIRQNAKNFYAVYRVFIGNIHGSVYVVLQLYAQGKIRLYQDMKKAPI